MNGRDGKLVEATADIVTAYVSGNSVGIGDLSGLIGSVYSALSGPGGAAIGLAGEVQVPAVSVRASVKQDYLVCLEDGKKLKMLKRYLSTHFGMSPAQYREKWGLPKDYPMVAPAYSATRRELALKIGLGKGGGRRPGVKGRKTNGKK